MLDLIRNNVQSFGVKFIVGIVVMVMVFFGVSAYRNQGINTIATIDGYEIKVSNDNTKGEKRVTIHVRSDMNPEDAQKLADKLYKDQLGS